MTFPLRSLVDSLVLLAAPALAADAATRALAAGNTAFAFELSQPLSSAPGSVFFSPYSLFTALGMTWAGARGVTSEEMASPLPSGRTSTAASPR